MPAARVAQIATVAAFGHDLADSAVTGTFAAAAHLPRKPTAAQAVTDASASLAWNLLKARRERGRSRRRGSSFIARAIANRASGARSAATRDVAMGRGRCRCAHRGRCRCLRLVAACRADPSRCRRTRVRDRRCTELHPRRVGLCRRSAAGHGLRQDHRQGRHGRHRRRPTRRARSSHCSTRRYEHASDGRAGSRGARAKQGQSRRRGDRVRQREADVRAQREAVRARRHQRADVRHRESELRRRADGSDRRRTSGGSRGGAVGPCRAQSGRHRRACAVRRDRHGQGGARGRNGFTDVGRRRLHAYRHRHDRRHVLARSRGRRQRELHQSRRAAAARDGQIERVSRLDRSRPRHRHHPDGRSCQSHGQGARQSRRRGRADPARDGREGGIPRCSRRRRRPRHEDDERATPRARAEGVRAGRRRHRRRLRRCRRRGRAAHGAARRAERGRASRACGSHGRYASGPRRSRIAGGWFEGAGSRNNALRRSATGSGP